MQSGASSSRPAQPCASSGPQEARCLCLGPGFQDLAPLRRSQVSDTALGCLLKNGPAAESKHILRSSQPPVSARCLPRNPKP